MEILWGFFGIFFSFWWLWVFVCILVSASSQVQHFLLPQEVKVLNLLIFLWSPESLNHLDWKRKFKIGQRHSCLPTAWGLSQYGSQEEPQTTLEKCCSVHTNTNVGQHRNFTGGSERQGALQSRSERKQKDFYLRYGTLLGREDEISSVKQGLVSQGISSVREEHKPSAIDQENGSFRSLKSFTKEKLLSFYPSCSNIICVMLLQDICILAAAECCQPKPNTKGFWGSTTQNQHL